MNCIYMSFSIKSVPSPAFVLWAHQSLSLLGRECTLPLTLRVTWHDVWSEKCCQWWISAKASGHNALMSSFQWRKSLCSLHLKRKNYSVVCLIDWLTKYTGIPSRSYLGKRPEDWGWSCVHPEAGPSQTQWGPRIEQNFLRESLWWFSLIS